VSKAFTKDEAPEAVILPARAPLPAGVPNYVTPRGLRLLRAELDALERARAAREGDAGEGQAARLGLITARLKELLGRVHSAVVVEPRAGPLDQVRLGATVVVRDRTGCELRFHIVGVDEADGKTGRIAFVAPFARALLGRRVGDVAGVQTPRGEDELEVVAIAYGEPPD
jgi:transcription elongation factor GreB